METSAHIHHLSTAASCQKVEPAMARLLNKRPNLWHLERKVWVTYQVLPANIIIGYWGRLTICFKRCFLFTIPTAHRCSVFQTIFCLRSKPTIGNLPHFEALLPPISCLLFYDGHSYFVPATWVQVKMVFCNVHKGCSKWQQKLIYRHVCRYMYICRYIIYIYT